MPRSFRPHIEPLEERAVPTSFTVGNTSDLDPPLTGSLRWAVQQANLLPYPSVTITFAGTLSGTIALNSALPALANPTTISAPNAGQITVERYDGPNTPAFGVID
jgi:hypothetical protein